MRPGDSLRWPRSTLYSQKLALTLPTSGGRAVGIVRLWIQAKELYRVQQANFLFLYRMRQANFLFIWKKKEVSLPHPVWINPYKKGS
jgi:hypothetical protein